MNQNKSKFLLEVELQRCKSVAGEEQVLYVDNVEERVAREVDLKGERAVAVVG